MILIQFTRYLVFLSEYYFGSSRLLYSWRFQIMLGFNCLWPKLILSFLLIIAGNYKVIEKNENQEGVKNLYYLNGKRKKVCLIWFCMVFLWIIGNEYQGGMPLLPPSEPTENNLWEKENRINFFEVVVVWVIRNKRKVLKGELW